MNTQRKNSLLLLLCAFIWGTAFVAQSAGSGMGACSFLAGRSWLAVLVLLPTVKVFDLVRQRSTGTTGAPKTPEERRCLRKASLVCGTLLFVASAAQQFGLTLNPSTAKAGFLTAMYVVLVPIFGLALGRRGSPQLWLSVAIAVCGLYLLCMQNGFGGVERSDMVLLLCAVLGYLVAQPLYYAAIALAAAALVLLIAAANGRQRAQQASAALGKLLRSYGAQDADGIYYQAEVHRAAYRACAAAMETERRAAAALEDAREHQCETHERLLQSLDFESGTGEAAALYQRRSALESVRTRLRTQQAQLTGAALAVGDPMALKCEHAQLLEQRDALERQYAALALAIETLGRADAELQSRFSPQLAQKAADYMDYLTSGRYDELVLARDLSAKARSADDPTPRDTAYLSAGTADLLYLSVRLALCELTCPTDDPCPLVLDDTLVNFDDARARRAMALFREIAQHRQVILFTCHERDCPAREQ